MQRGLRLNGQESALLWTQYFKLEVLYVNKLRGRRGALGIEEGTKKEQGEGGGEGEEESEGIHVPRLEGEDDDTEEEAKEEKGDEDDPRARSVRAVLAGAVPRMVYLSAIKARPRDLDMRLAFVETLEELGGQQQQSETEGEGGREERSEGAFEDLVQEILGGIEEAFGVAEAAWARAKHALTRRGGQVGGEVEVRATTNKRKTNVRRNSSSSSSKKRRYSSSLTATWVDDEEAVTGWREGLEGGARECMAVLDTTLAAAADLDRKAEEDKKGKRYDLLNKMWQYYLRGLLELLHAPGSVLRAAFARREVALSGEGGREGEVASGLTLEPGMYLIWASLWVAPSVLSSPLAQHVEEDGKEEGNVQEARRVLDKAIEAHPLHARLWEARLRAEAWGEGGRVGDVFTKARQALGPTAGIDELGEGRGSEEEEGEARRIAVAGCWWVYLDWLMLVGGEGKRRKSENTTSGSSESDSDSEAEEGEKDGVEWQEEGKRAVSPEVVKALEHALVSTRGPGRVALCRLWHRCLGRRGLQQAMTYMGDGRAEEREDMAALCLEALNEGKEEAGLTVAWFEAALAVCGKAETEEAAALWEAYEIFERGQGRHQAANNVRWRRGKATGEK